MTTELKPEDTTPAPNEEHGIHIVHVVEDESRQLHLRMDRGKDPSMLVGLYQVVLTVERYSYTDPDKEKDNRHRTKLVPATSMYYVVAESEEGAISQVSDAPIGIEPKSAIDGNQAIKEGRMTATATRIPMHVRGWGLHTF